jgi:hypothetical protein
MIFGSAASFINRLISEDRMPAAALEKAGIDTHLC